MVRPLADDTDTREEVVQLHGDNQRCWLSTRTEPGSQLDEIRPVSLCRRQLGLDAGGIQTEMQ